MVTTALIFPPTEDSFRTVAGLAVIHRAVLAALRSGFERVVVLENARTEPLRAILDSDPRTRAVEITADVALLDSTRVALIPSDCVLTAATLQRLAGVHVDGGPLLFSASGDVAISLCDPSHLAALEPGSLVGIGAAGLWETLRGHGAATLPLDGELCMRVTGSSDVVRAERALCDRLRADSAATDGPLAHWLDRHISLRLSCCLVTHTALRPNHITAIGTSVGVLAAALFGVGTYWTGLCGALLFLCAVVIDGCDGEVARLTFQESRFGQKFDVITDNLVHVAVFIGLAVGMYHRDPQGHHVLLLTLLLGGFAVDCAASYFFLVRRPGFASSGGTPVSRKGQVRRWVLRAFEALMNRDFAYLLLLLALVDRLHWFLWGAAFGTYVFAILLVCIYRWAPERGDSAHT